MGCTLAYCSLSGHFLLAAVDAPLSREINFLLEWVRFGTKSKLTRKGVYLAYIPFRGNELGAEDDPLSQEITLGEHSKAYP